ncbi:nucleotidyl transferase AbiEii/AbiGii toxin family protein [Clostridium lacusfryxellense]|uniref:nucleotidyl transferase AbiEii/AbiGii toxin family protein n=1 Tax=Clostridium lacusfryxellense TaxID=205328 RepID=UPI001C0CE12F|nr:nucleotidyl transferase AbiEii/AbiGii toxin family protein [Clostridium lacusfryxellense]MBU3112070.1 nucleotidyl transferase AbiEii/AbiGii toxin family protein [Clostridium lacusfryxellense]
MIKIIFDDITIQVFEYNLKTVLTEKLDTMVSRNDRMRDFYDVYILTKLQAGNIKLPKLKPGQ